MDHQSQVNTSVAAGKTSGLAIASLALGIGGIFLSIIASIPAIVTGHIAIKKVRESKGSLGGAGMATAGLILGYCITGLGILAVFGFISGLGAISNQKNFSARSDCTNLVGAIEGYYDQYARFPNVGAASESAPIPSDADLMNILVGSDEIQNPFDDAQNPLADAQNPLGIRFIQAKTARGTSLADARGGLWTERGNTFLRDPWGNPYYVLLDTPGSGEGDSADISFKDPFARQPMPGLRVLCWSAGKDGKMDYDNPESRVNKDNVYSWR